MRLFLVLTFLLIFDATAPAAICPDLKALDPEAKSHTAAQPRPAPAPDPTLPAREKEASDAVAALGAAAQQRLREQAVNFHAPAEELSLGDLEVIVASYRDPHSPRTAEAEQALARVGETIQEALHDRARRQDYPDLAASTEPGKKISPELIATTIEKRLLTNRPDRKAKLDRYGLLRRELIDGTSSIYYEFKRTAEAKRLERVREQANALRERLLSPEGVDLRASGASDEVLRAVWEKVSSGEARTLVSRWKAAQGPEKARLESSLRALAKELRLYEPHALEKLERGLEDWVTAQDVSTSTSQSGTAATRARQPIFEIQRRLTFLFPENVPGYEPEPPVPSSRPQPDRIIISHELMAEGLAPTYRNQLGPDFRVVRFNGGPRDSVKNPDVWLKDRKPLAITINEGGKQQLVLAHFDNPLYEQSDSFRTPVPPPARPAGVDPRAEPFEIGGRVVWAIRDRFHFKMEGGNFIQLKDHAVLTNRVEVDNSRDFSEIAPDIARVTRLQTNQVHRIVSAPGETTGHADLVVGRLSFEQNAVAVPEIPEYVIEHLKTSDPERYALAERLNREYLSGVAADLAAKGITVRRVPMLAPITIPETRGKSLSPYGIDAHFLSTVNWQEGPGNQIMVPVYSREMEALSPEAQRRFHQDIARVTREFGLRYTPVDATGLISTNGGLHCITWSAPIYEHHP